ncbi:MAG: hypothetical protein EZS28_036113, partial [Streblomastix strix]
MITANEFIQSGGTNEQVLLANGTTKSLSEFASGGETFKILTSQVAINETQFATPKQEGFALSTNIKIGTLPELNAPTVIKLCMPVGGPYSGFKPHITNTGEIRCYIVGSSWIEQICFSEICIFGPAGIFKPPANKNYPHKPEQKSDLCPITMLSPPPPPVPINQIRQEVRYLTQPAAVVAIMNDITRENPQTRDDQIWALQRAMKEHSPQDYSYSKVCGIFSLEKSRFGEIARSEGIEKRTIAPARKFTTKQEDAFVKEIQNRYNE